MTAPSERIGYAKSKTVEAPKHRSMRVKICSVSIQSVLVLELYFCADVSNVGGYKRNVWFNLSFYCRLTAIWAAKKRGDLWRNQLRQCWWNNVTSYGSGFNTINGSGPAYLSELLHVYTLSHAGNQIIQMQDSWLSHLLLLWAPHLEFTPTRP